jgi:hypothetical protein
MLITMLASGLLDAAAMAGTSKAAAEPINKSDCEPTTSEKSHSRPGDLVARQQAQHEADRLQRHDQPQQTQRNRVSSPCREDVGSSSRHLTRGRPGCGRGPFGRLAIELRLRLPITDTGAVAAVGPCYPQSRPVIAGLH